MGGLGVVLLLYRVPDIIGTMCGSPTVGSAATIVAESAVDLVQATARSVFAHKP